MASLPPEQPPPSPGPNSRSRGPTSTLGRSPAFDHRRAPQPIGRRSAVVGPFGDERCDDRCLVLFPAQEPNGAEPARRKENVGGRVRCPDANKGSRKEPLSTYAFRLCDPGGLAQAATRSAVRPT